MGKNYYLFKEDRENQKGEIKVDLLELVFSVEKDFLLNVFLCEIFRDYAYDFHPSSFCEVQEFNDFAIRKLSIGSYECSLFLTSGINASEFVSDVGHCP